MERRQEFVRFRRDDRQASRNKIHSRSRCLDVKENTTNGLKKKTSKDLIKWKEEKRKREELLKRNLKPAFKVYFKTTMPEVSPVGSQFLKKSCLKNKTEIIPKTKFSTLKIISKVSSSQKESSKSITKINSRNASRIPRLVKPFIVPRPTPLISNVSKAISKREPLVNGSNVKHIPSKRSFAPDEFNFSFSLPFQSNAEHRRKNFSSTPKNKNGLQNELPGISCSTIHTTQDHDTSAEKSPEKAAEIHVELHVKVNLTSSAKIKKKTDRSNLHRQSMMNGDSFSGEIIVSHAALTSKPSLERHCVRTKDEGFSSDMTDKTRGATGDATNIHKVARALSLNSTPPQSLLPNQSRECSAFEDTVFRTCLSSTNDASATSTRKKSVAEGFTPRRSARIAGKENRSTRTNSTSGSTRKNCPSCSSWQKPDNGIGLFTPPRGRRSVLKSFDGNLISFSPDIC